MNCSRRLCFCLAMACEAAVFAALSAGYAAEYINVARAGTAAQSSQMGPFGPELAIDGLYTNFTHTLSSDAGATWQVDLGREFPISEIALYNRADCCGSRLRDITVSILDAGRNAVWHSGLLNPENELGAFPLGPPELRLDLVALEGRPVSGRIVRVHRTADLDLSGTGGRGNADEPTVLSLAEVEVLVDRAHVPVMIAKHPVGGRAYVGRCYAFSVELFNADAAASITYQWFKDGTKIAGATGPRLILAPLKKSDSGTYRVEVTVDGNILKSEPAVLVVPGFNVALFGTASQSSMGWGGLPERAIDGNVSGRYDDASVTHTMSEDGAWWQVKLYGDAVVDTVVLWNRIDDCCRLRLSNFRVSALASDGAEIWGEDFFTDLAYPEIDFEIDMGGIKCRAIRVQRIGPDMQGNNYLSLAEVEVFGDGFLPPQARYLNVARGCGATTWQSSQLAEYHAGLAVDGIYTNFTHTLSSDDNATWEVDLHGEYDIALIALYNRTDCCGSRLRDITVSVLDGRGDLAWQSDLLNPENELSSFPLGPPQIRLNFIEMEGKPIRGQIVRVRREPDWDYSGGGDGSNPDEASVLSLAEVEVFTMPASCPATGDTHCKGLTIEGPEDNYPGIYRVTAKAIDDDGDRILYQCVFDNGIGPPIVIGPQEGNTFESYLASGRWTITVNVDDDPVCTDRANDSSCSMGVDVLEIENLARAGIATQSSDYGGGAYPAAFAIDGNYGNFTHTAAGNNGLGPAWWEVDLLAEYSVGKVVLYNRTSCCGSRLRDITVYILDSQRDLVWQSELLNPENQLGQYPLGPPILTVDLEKEEGRGLVGRYVRIERLPDPDLSGTGGQGNPDELDVLSLAEVEVYPPRGAVEKPRFRRGDPNDDGRVNITDAIYILNYLFLGGETPGCLEAADANDDGGINITDGVYVLNFLFLGGPDPPPPGPGACGRDPAGSPARPGCETYRSC